MFWGALGVGVVLVLAWAEIGTRRDARRKKNQDDDLARRWLEKLEKNPPPIPPALQHPPPREFEVPPHGHPHLQHLVRNGVATAGIVIKAELDVDEDGHGAVEIQLAFRAPNGEPMLRSYNTGSRVTPPWGRNGQPVTVLFDPSSGAWGIYETGVGVETPA